MIAPYYEDSSVLELDKTQICWYNGGMRNNKGRFVQGYHYSPATEFKVGEHWRPHQAFRDKEYLIHEYVENRRSATEIAAEFGVTHGAVLFWLHKHQIPRRSTTETRSVKHWGVSGPDNPMFGRTGAVHPNWKGGITPDRQRVYSSLAWSHAIRLVWERDGGRCTECGKTDGRSHYMHIHHDKSFKDYPELRCEVGNLRLVCSKCHVQFHPRAKRR